MCRIGRDLYLATSAGLMLLDTGLLQGWALSRADDDATFTAGATLVTKPRATMGTQHDVLF